MCRQRRVGKTETECRKESAGKIAVPVKSLVISVEPPAEAAGCPCRLSIILYLLQKPLQCVDGACKKLNRS